MENILIVDGEKTIQETRGQTLAKYSNELYINNK